MPPFENPTAVIGSRSALRHTSSSRRRPGRGRSSMLSVTGTPMASWRNHAKPGPSRSGPRGARPRGRRRAPAPRPARSSSVPPRPWSASSVRAPSARGPAGGPGSRGVLAGVAAPSGPRARPGSARPPPARSTPPGTRPARTRAISTSRTSSGVTPAPSAPRTCQPSCGPALSVAVTASATIDRSRRPRPGRLQRSPNAERGGQLLEVRRDGAPALHRPVPEVQLRASSRPRVSRSSPSARSSGPLGVLGSAQGHEPLLDALAIRLVLRRQRSSSPSRSGSSSTANPGLTVAISNSTRPGSWK